MIIMLREQQSADDNIDRAFSLSAVTDDQLTEELKRVSQNALCKLETKRSLEWRFVKLREAILKDINTVGPASNTSLKAFVESISDQLRNNHVIKYTKNNALIPCLLSIIGIAETLTHALEKYQQQQQDMACATRHGKTST